MAALGVILVWLFTNNANLEASVTTPDLGSRSESYLVKEIEPLIGQLALLALVASAVIWLTGGLIRKILSGLTAAILLFLAIEVFGVTQDSVDKIKTNTTFSGEVTAVSPGYLTYALILTAAISALLFFISLGAKAVDRSKRPKIKTDRDTWNSQDEGIDPTR